MGSEPELRLAGTPEPGPAFHFHHQLDAQRRERRGEELLAAVVVADRQSDVVDDHGLLLFVGRFSFMLQHPAAPGPGVGLTRLPGEPADGVPDLHIHPLEPMAVRLTLSKTF